MTNADPSLVALVPALADAVASTAPGREGVIAAGICGSQGSGKTTLSRLLETELAARGCRAVTLSLDDFYLPRADRQALARDVHPLCATRGVPGTHDMVLYEATLASLARPGATRVPVFSKLDDDRLPADAWHRIEGPVDAVLFEGWCVGAAPEPDDAWTGPINELEASEDPDGVWWRWWNGCLARDYWPRWRDLSPLMLIKVPGLESVIASRVRQEEGLARAEGRPVSMDRAAVERFVAHYERLTRRIWAEMPGRADIVIGRDDNFRFRMLEPAPDSQGV